MPQDTPESQALRPARAFSFVIHCFNERPFTLFAAIRSCVSPRDEVVVVFDHETPPYAVPEAFFAGPVRVLHTGTERAGAAAAWNLGLAAAVHPAVVVLEADDMLLPGFRDVLAPRLDSHAVIVQSTHAVDELGFRVPQPELPQCDSDLDLSGARVHPDAAKVLAALYSFPLVVDRGVVGEFRFDPSAGEACGLLAAALVLAHLKARAVLCWEPTCQRTIHPSPPERAGRVAHDLRALLDERAALADQEWSPGLTPAAMHFMQCRLRLVDAWSIPARPSDLLFPVWLAAHTRARELRDLEMVG